jgi:hypothetical protein
MSSPCELSEYEQKILKNVSEHGCHVTYVFDPDGKEPDFCYSTGLASTVGQPEVITFGLSRAVMHFMVNETLEQCGRGLVLTEGARVDGLIEGFHCVARCVEPSNIASEYFASAIWHHRYRTSEKLNEAIQLVWPGALSGLYPWEAGCDPSVIAAQPPLYDKEYPYE